MPTLNHPGTQNRRSRLQLLLVVTAMVMAVATVMVMRQSRRRQRGGHRSRRRRHLGRCLARLGSVPEPAAGLLPLALGAPLLLVVHAVHLAALFVLAAGSPVRRQRGPVRPRCGAGTRAGRHEATVERLRRRGRRGRNDRGRRRRLGVVGGGGHGRSPW